MNHKLVSKVLIKVCGGVIKVLEDNVLDRDSLFEEDTIFVEKLSNTIKERVNSFRAIGLEMGLVSFP